MTACQGLKLALSPSLASHGYGWVLIVETRATRTIKIDVSGVIQTGSINLPQCAFSVTVRRSANNPVFVYRSPV